ncbi:MAG TPA: nuclear transport factor 2 family protein [Candidatus Dormibacteraeota bacterium]|nr:nuclear transport factor 2 family protein [Candidatus Dormibacteraeota bacterium]
MSDPAVRRLLDRAAIEELKARYFRFVDTKRWDDLALCFTEDASLAAGGNDARGREAIIALVRRFLDDGRSVHQGHMPEITFDSDDSASGVWAMFDLVERPGEGVRAGFGHYHETYVRDGEQWRIATLRLERLRVDHLPQSAWT